VGRAAALHEVPARHLVGAVDGDVHGRLLEGRQRNPRLDGALPGLKGGRDTLDSEVRVPEGADGVRRRAPVPRPTTIPSATSSAAASPARRFAASLPPVFFMAECGTRPTKTHALDGWRPLDGPETTV